MASIFPCWAASLGVAQLRVEALSEKNDSIEGQTESKTDRQTETGRAYFYKAKNSYPCLMMSSKLCNTDLVPAPVQIEVQIEVQIQVQGSTSRHSAHPWRGLQARTPQPHATPPEIRRRGYFNSSSSLIPPHNTTQHNLACGFAPFFRQTPSPTALQGSNSRRTTPNTRSSPRLQPPH